MVLIYINSQSPMKVALKKMKQVTINKIQFGMNWIIIRKSFIFSSKERIKTEGFGVYLCDNEES